jgi:predicted nucleotidyltransferase component of viral defense system
MKYSKIQLQKAADDTGFRAEILEKVFLLMDLLEALFNNRFLRNSLVLKGGTALNLFYLQLPRLSVDIDLNYIGSNVQGELQKEKGNLQEQINSICEVQGLTLYRNPTAYAGGKAVWRYPSALGNMGNLEVDLNFMHRVPIFPVMLKNSCNLAGRIVKNIPVLDINELMAGKLVALLNRSLGRDLFDVHNLLSTRLLAAKKSRFAFVVYSAMSRENNFLKMSPEQVSFDFTELKNRLLPLLTSDSLHDYSNEEKWVQKMVFEARNYLKKMLSFRKKEREFLQSILLHGDVKPELLSKDNSLCEKIKSHPAIQWAAYNVKRNAKV